MSLFQYDEFIGTETLCKEYKEFSFFKTGFDMETEESEMYCETNSFEFTHLVLSNLSMYIKQYIPRYISGFWNADIKSGSVYIGVNDYGLIKGIAVKSVNERELYRKLKKTLSKYNDKSVSITFELCPITTPPMPSTFIHPDYTDYICKKELFIERYNAFLKTYEEWKQKYCIISCKLIDIVNTPVYRKQLQEFIQTIDPSNSVIHLLDTDFILQYKSGLEMRAINFNDTNPYYWVTLFKDKIIDESKKSKPVFTETFYKNVPYNLLIGGEMVPYWMNYNNDMSLYVVRINIKLNPTSEPLYYYYIQSDKMIKCKRVMERGQPVCLPI